MMGTAGAGVAAGGLAALEFGAVEFGGVFGVDVLAGIGAMLTFPSLSPASCKTRLVLPSG